MKQLTAAWAASAAFVLVACGPNDDDHSSGMTFAEACAFVEGCEDPGFGVSGPTVAIWRVTVVNETDGSYHIRDVDEVDVAASLGPPPSPLGGQRALAALDADGEPLEVHLLNFADTLTWESIDGDHETRPVDGPLSAVGFLVVDPAVASIAIVQDDGSIDDVLDAPKRGASQVQRFEARAFEANPPLSACSHVQLATDGVLADAAPRDGTLVPIDPLQEALVRATLQELTPAHCAGVRRIVFVDATKDRDNTGGWVTWHGNRGDIVHINASATVRDLSFTPLTLASSAPARALFRYVVAHEVAHTTHALINLPTNGGSYSGEWAPSQKSTMFSAVESMRLEAGLDAAWNQMTSSFVTLGWAAPYGGNLRGLLAAEVTHSGYMSSYSDTSLSEDFAETVARPVTRRHFEDAGVPFGEAGRRGDYGCKTFGEAPSDGLSQAFAPLYTKLSMVRDMGMITQEHFDDCVGRVGLQFGEHKLALYIDERQQVVFQDVEAGMSVSPDDGYEFHITATGTVPTTDGMRTAKITIRMRPPVPSGVNDWSNLSWVRGAFNVGLTRPGRFMLEVETDSNLSYNATEGVALITQASDSTIRGDMVVQAATRFGAFGVPQVIPSPQHYYFHLQR